MIDSHVHFWDRGRFDYAWLERESPALQRDFRPADLATAQASLTRVRPAGLVVVQADCRRDQGQEEVAWVHELAASGAPVLAVVAHAPLEEGSRCESLLDDLVGSAPLVSGVRRLLQDEAPGFLSAPGLLTGLRLLPPRGLVMDLCVRQHQLDAVRTLVECCPDGLFVLDHLGKPVISDEELPSWAASVTRLAALPNVCCKMSGLLTEAPPQRRTAPSLRPWLEHALEVFGPSRCMFASDWPPVADAGGYHAWCETVLDLLDELTNDDRTSVLSGTAARTYDPVNRAARAKDACRGADR